MSKRSNGLTEAKIKKWIKEGRGNGHGPKYKPWLTARDVASKGRSHRIFGHKSRRIHHLFSDLELAVFLVLIGVTRQLISVSSFHYSKKSHLN